MGLLQGYARSFRGLDRMVWLLAAVSLINRAGSMVAPFLAVYLKTQLNYSTVAVGQLLAGYGVGTLLGISLGGRLSDRLGPRTVMAASLGGSAITFLVLSGLDSQGELALALFALGVFNEAFRPANNTAIARHSGEAERSRAFGLARLAANLGWTIGPAVGGFLAVINYRALFYVDAATCFVAASFVLAVLPADAPGKGVHQEEHEPGSGRSPFSDRRFVTAHLLLLAQALLFFQFQSTLPLYCREILGITEDKLGLVLAVNAVLIILFEMQLLAGAERLNALRVVALAGFLTGLGFGMTLFATGIWTLMVSVIVWTVGEMLSIPIMTAWASRRAPAASRGRYMGAHSLVFSIGAVLAPIGGTALYSLDPNAVWYVCFALGVIQWFGFRRLALREP